jgi:hypothetical protein
MAISLAMVLLAALMAAGAPLRAESYFPHPEAPRLVNYYLRAAQDDIVGKEEFLARFDMLILPYQAMDWWPGSLAQIKQINPELKLFLYIDPFLVTATPSGSPGDLQYDFATGVYEDWYAYTTTGEIIVFWPGSYHVNFTEVCPIRDGERYRDYFIRFLRERFFPLIQAGAIDGVFLDEMSSGGYLWWSTFFDGDFDYDLNGVADPLPTIETWLFNSQRLFADSLAAALPTGGALIGNNCKPRHAALDGKFYEAFPAEGWENGVNGTLQDLDIWNSLADGINVTGINGVHTIQPTDPRAFRYRFAASLLADDYFGFDHDTYDHHQLEWFDLYNLELGLPLGERYVLGETPQVAEDFEHGMGSVVRPFSAYAQVTVTTDPAEVITGGASLRVEVTSPDPWPSPLEMVIPGGYAPDSMYTVSFHYRVLASDNEADQLFVKAKAGSVNESSAVTAEARIQAGCYGLYRDQLDLGDYMNYHVYLKTQGRVTFVMDDLRITKGWGGVWARDYQYGSVVCNEMDTTRVLPHQPGWVLADGDGQRELYGAAWEAGEDLLLQAWEGLVFLNDVVAVDDAPGEPVPAAGRSLVLRGPWPNPGNPAFSVRVSAAEGERLQLSLHDVQGRRLAALWEGTVPEPGLTLSFRAGEGGLPQLPSGVYLIRAESGGRILSRRWVLLR